MLGIGLHKKSENVEGLSDFEDIHSILSFVQNSQG
jgi:hypothetical protein